MKLRILLLIAISLLTTLTFTGLILHLTIRTSLDDLSLDLAQTDTPGLSALPDQEGQVLQANTQESPNSNIVFKVPAIFDTTTTFRGNLEADGQNLNLGEGEITASNVIYSLEAGNGITITGDQDLVISTNLEGTEYTAVGEGIAVDNTGRTIQNTGVTSFQEEIGAIELEKGSGIDIQGLRISNQGVLTIQGESGDVLFEAGNGINIDGTTISATGDVKEVFRIIEVDGDDDLITAGNNNDKLTFVAGSGITLDSDGVTKQISLSVDQDDLAWKEDTGVVSLTNTASNVAVGAGVPTSKLHIFGTATVSNDINIGNAVIIDGSTIGSFTGDGLTVDPGNNLTLELLTSKGTSLTNSTSGLQKDSNGIGLLQGCQNGEVLKYNATLEIWECTVDVGGTGSGIVFVQEGEATVTNVANILDFNAGDFTITESPVTEVNVQIDYANFADDANEFNLSDSSNITRIDIGGVDDDSTTTLNILTNNSSADILNIGNDNSATLLALTGGDDWSIDSTGNAIFTQATIANLNINTNTLSSTSAGLTLDSFSNEITFAASDTTLTASGLTTIDTAATVTFTDDLVIGGGDFTIGQDGQDGTLTIYNELGATDYSASFTTSASQSEDTAYTLPAALPTAADWILTGNDSGVMSWQSIATLNVGGDVTDVLEGTYIDVVNGTGPQPEVSFDPTELETVTWGSGTEAFTWTFSSNASNPSIAFTEDISLTATSVDITGALTVSSNLSAEGDIDFNNGVANTIQLGDSNDTTSITGDVWSVSSAGAATLTQADIDNLRLDANTLSSTSAGLTLDSFSNEITFAASDTTLTASGLTTIDTAATVTFTDDLVIGGGDFTIGQDGQDGTLTIYNELGATDYSASFTTSASQSEDTAYTLPAALPTAADWILTGNDSGVMSWQSIATLNVGGDVTDVLEGTYIDVVNGTGPQPEVSFDPTELETVTWGSGTEAFTWTFSSNASNPSIAFTEDISLTATSVDITGALTVSSNLSAEGDIDFNNGVANTIQLGDSNDTTSITGDVWSVSSAGAATLTQADIDNLRLDANTLSSTSAGLTLDSFSNEITFAASDTTLTASGLTTIDTAATVTFTDDLVIGGGDFTIGQDGQDGTLTIYNELGATDYSASFTTSASQSEDTAYTLPATLPTAADWILTGNDSGVMSWQSIATLNVGGDVTDVLEGTYIDVVNGTGPQPEVSFDPTELETVTWGSGTEAFTWTFSSNASNPSIAFTEDISLTATSVDITGALTVSSNLSAEGDIDFNNGVANTIQLGDSNDTTSITGDVWSVSSAGAATLTQADIDNLRLDANTLSSTSAGLTLDSFSNEITFDSSDTTLTASGLTTIDTAATVTFTDDLVIGGGDFTIGQDGQDGTLTIYNELGATDYSASFTTSASQSEDTAYTLPATLPTAADWILTGNDSGVMSWQSIATLNVGGDVTDVLEGTYIDVVNGTGPQPEVSFDPTELETVTWGSGTEAFTWTFSSNASNPSIAFTEDISLTATSVDITGDLTATGNADFAGTLTSGTANAFVVNAAGTVTIADGQAYTSAGALTLSSGAAGGLTLDSASNEITFAASDTTLTASGLTTIDTASTVTFQDDMVIAGGDLTIGSDGNNASIVFYNERGAVDYNITLEASDETTTSFSYKLPPAPPDANNDFLVSETDGQLYWRSIVDLQVLGDITDVLEGDYIDIVDSAGPQPEVSFDPTELETVTWGSGTEAFTWTFSSNASNPSIAFTEDISLTATSVDITGALTVSSNLSAEGDIDFNNGVANTIQLGDSNDTTSITGDVWSVSSAGAATLTQADIDNLRLDANTLSSTSAGLTLDSFSNEITFAASDTTLTASGLTTIDTAATVTFTDDLVIGGGDFTIGQDGQDGTLTIYNELGATDYSASFTTSASQSEDTAYTLPAALPTAADWILTGNDSGVMSWQSIATLNVGGDVTDVLEGTYIDVVNGTGPQPEVSFDPTELETVTWGSGTEAFTWTFSSNASNPSIAFTEDISLTATSVDITGALTVSSNLSAEGDIDFNNGVANTIQLGDSNDTTSITGDVWSVSSAGAATLTQADIDNLRLDANTLSSTSAGLTLDSFSNEITFAASDTTLTASGLTTIDTAATVTFTDDLVIGGGDFTIGQDGQDGTLTIYNELGATDYSASFTTSASQSEDTAYTLPAALPTAADWILTGNDSGVMSWQSIATLNVGGDVTDVLEGTYIDVVNGTGPQPEVSFDPTELETVTWGSGTEAFTWTFSSNASNPSIAFTEDISLTATSVDITGALTVSSNLSAEGDIDFNNGVANTIQLGDSNDTTSITGDVWSVSSAGAATLTQADIDNLRLDANTLSSTSAGLTLDSFSNEITFAASDTTLTASGLTTIDTAATVTFTDDLVIGGGDFTIGQDGQDGTLTIYNELGATDYSASFTTSASQSEDTAYTLPAALPTAADWILTGNDSGVMSWQSIATLNVGGDVTDVLEGTYIDVVNGTGPQPEVSFDPTELETVTWGSGTEAFTWTFSSNASNPSIAFTEDISLTATSVDITGALTVSSNLSAEGDIDFNNGVANTIQLGDSNDTTSITGDVWSVSSAGAATLTQADIDNLRLDANTLSSTSAGLTLDSFSNEITFAASDTTLTASGLTTIDTASTVTFTDDLVIGGGDFTVGQDGQDGTLTIYNELGATDYSASFTTSASQSEDTAYTLPAALPTAADWILTGNDSGVMSLAIYRHSQCWW
jgi:hypothetical protein